MATPSDRPDSNPLPAGKSQPIEGPRLERVEITADLQHLNLTNGQFTDIAAKKTRFVNVDFSFSVFTRAYFHEAVFEKCRFTGCRFYDCNFRGASFLGCDFKYAFLDRTVISCQEIIFTSPAEWPNVNRALMQILRVNAETLGDYDAQKIFIREEMEAAREHLRRARQRQDSYYRKKYGGITMWFAIRWQSLLLWLDRRLLGHGEHLGRAALGSMGLLALIALSLFASTQSWASDPTASTLISNLWVCVKYVVFTLLDVPFNVEFAVPTAFVILIVLLRYFLIGLLVSALWRHVSHR